MCVNPIKGNVKMKVKLKKTDPRNSVKEFNPENLRKWWKELKPLLEGDPPYLRSSYWWGKIEQAINRTADRD